MEVRKIENGIEVVGYANVTGSKSYVLEDSNGFKFTEEITEGAYKKALKRAKIEDRSILFLDEHMPSEVMAQTGDNTLELDVDNIGLKVKSQITNPKYFPKFENRTSMSFGFRCLEDKKIPTLDGKTSYHRVVEDIELFEVTRTDNPAYAKSQLEKRGLENIEYRNIEVAPVDDWLETMKLRFRYAKSL